MSRKKIDTVALGKSLLTDGASNSLAFIGEFATAQVYLRQADGTNGTQAPVYSGATGSSTLTQPLDIDTSGRVPGYLDRPNEYNIVLTLGANTWTEAVDAPTLIQTTLADWSGVADGVTDNTSALVAAMGSGGKEIEIDDGVYHFNATGPINVPDGTVIRFKSRDAVFQVGGATYSLNYPFLVATDGVTFRMSGGHLDGPPSVGAAYDLAAVKADGTATAGKVILKDMKITNFRRGALVGSTRIGIFDFEDVEIEGRGPGDTVGSDGIQMGQGAPGSEVRFRNVSVSKCGKEADNKYHGAYIGTGVNIDWDGGVIDNMIGTGYTVMHYTAATTAPTPAKFARFRNMYFGPAASAVSGGNAPLATSDLATPTLLENITFDTPRKAIDLRGRGTMRNCNFINQSTTNFWQVSTSGDNPDPAASVPIDWTLEGNEFATAGTIRLADIYPQQNNVILRLIGNTFRPGSTHHINTVAGTTGAQIRSRANHYLGGVTNTYVIYDEGAASDLDFADDEFNGAGLGMHVGVLAQPAGITIDHIDFSHSGTVGQSLAISNLPPTNKFNPGGRHYGTVGYLTENAAQLATDPGGTVTWVHGLRRTPSVLGGMTRLAGHIVSVVTYSNTQIVYQVTDHAGVAVAPGYTLHVWAKCLHE